MKKRLVVFSITLALAVASVVPALASNDNIYYSFTMKSKRIIVYWRKREIPSDKKNNKSLESKNDVQR